MMDKMISGADDPSAMSVRLATVGFPMRTEYCTGWPDKSTVFTTFSLAVMVSMEFLWECVHTGT